MRDDGGGCVNVLFAMGADSHKMEGMEKRVSSCSKVLCTHHSRCCASGAGRIGSESMTSGAVRAAQNAAASELAAAVERRGFTGDAIKRARFNEFISGFLSVSVFHAADVWLPLSAGGGQHGGSGAAGGSDGTPRLFVFSSDVKVSFFSKRVQGGGGAGLA